jgi:hypothetical protein
VIEFQPAFFLCLAPLSAWIPSYGRMTLVFIIRYNRSEHNSPAAIVPIDGNDIIWINVMLNRAPPGKLHAAGRQLLDQAELGYVGYAAAMSQRKPSPLCRAARDYIGIVTGHAEAASPAPTYFWTPSQTGRCTSQGAYRLVR